MADKKPQAGGAGLPSPSFFRWVAARAHGFRPREQVDYLGRTRDDHLQDLYVAALARGRPQTAAPEFVRQVVVNAGRDACREDVVARRYGAVGAFLAGDALHLRDDGRGALEARLQFSDFVAVVGARAVREHAAFVEKGRLPEGIRKRQAFTRARRIRDAARDILGSAP